MTPGCSPQIVSVNLEFVGMFSKFDLCGAPSHFVREVRKLDGSNFPPNTIRKFVIMIKMYLHERNVFWKLLDEVAFVCLHNVMDNTMKE